MKIEPKFRDYDMETKTIRYFDLDSYDRYEHDAYGNIMQYSGLKDKHGKGIYEGDIIDIHQTVNGYSKFVLVSVIGEYDIRFLKEDGNYSETYPYDAWDLLDVYCEDKDIEVIGNIHQNITT